MTKGKYKYIDYFDIKAPDSHMLRMCIEEWLDAQLEYLSNKHETIKVYLKEDDGTYFKSVNVDVYKAECNALLSILGFMCDVGLIGRNVFKKYMILVSEFKNFEEKEK